MELGLGELLFIFILALLLFGPKRLPEIGRQVGRMLAEFKRAKNEFQAQLQEEMQQLEIESRAAKAAASAPALPPAAPAGTVASRPPGEPHLPENALPAPASSKAPDA